MTQTFTTEESMTLVLCSLPGLGFCNCPSSHYHAWQYQETLQWIQVLDIIFPVSICNNNSIASWKRTDQLSLPVVVLLSTPPGPLAWEPLSDQAAVCSFRFNGSLTVSFVGNPPHTPSPRNQDLQPIRAHRNEKREVCKWFTGSDGRTSLGKSRILKNKKHFLAYLDLQEP